nr:hypothetical protein [Tanacetum cinerariifolium]
MNNSNITMEEYIRLEKKKARRKGKAALSCETTLSPLNDNEIDFRISFHKSDDEDYMSLGGNVASSGLLILLQVLLRLRIHKRYRRCGLEQAKCLLWSDTVFQDWRKE